MGIKGSRDPSRRARTVFDMTQTVELRRILCLGNDIVGDDGVGLAVGRYLLGSRLPRGVSVELASACYSETSWSTAALSSSTLALVSLTASSNCLRSTWASLTLSLVQVPLA